MAPLTPFAVLSWVSCRSPPPSWVCGSQDVAGGLQPSSWQGDSRNAPSCTWSLLIQFGIAGKPRRAPVLLICSGAPCPRSHCAKKARNYSKSPILHHSSSFHTPFQKINSGARGSTFSINRKKSCELGLIQHIQ